MNKQFSSLPMWQWRRYADDRRHSSNPLLRLFSVPLLVTATLLLIDGVLDPSVPSIAIGLISLAAGIGMQSYKQD